MRPVCSTLYATLPHNLIKDKLIDLTEKTCRVWVEKLEK